MSEPLHVKITPWPPKDRPFFVTLMVLFVASLILLFGLKSWNEWRQHKFIGVPIERNTITVSGEGKVTAIPDIAVLNLGATAERQTVGAAQKDNTAVMNALIAKLKEIGVESKDIQTTNYSISPAYDYTEGRSRLRGYIVSQNARVKVRNLDVLGDALAAAGNLGANQVGGIEFSVDEPEALRSQAREKAFAHAKEKAQALARQVGVKLRRVVSLQESSFAPPSPIPYYGVEDFGLKAAPSPQIEAGSAEIIVTASMTYEIE